MLGDEIDAAGHSLPIHLYFFHRLWHLALAFLRQMQGSCDLVCSWMAVEPNGVTTWVPLAAGC